MAYSKLLVDNTTCARRYHITFDNEAANVPRVEVRCQLCDAVIFTEENHPPVTLARTENLTKTSALAETLVSTCNFEDRLSKQTVPAYKDRDAHVYPEHVSPGTRK